VYVCACVYVCSVCVGVCVYVCRCVGVDVCMCECVCMWSDGSTVVGGCATPLRAGIQEDQGLRGDQDGEGSY